MDVIMYVDTYDLKRITRTMGYDGIVAFRVHYNHLRFSPQSGMLRFGWKTSSSTGRRRWWRRRTTAKRRRRRRVEKLAAV